MSDMRDAIEKARFKVIEGAPFEAYMVKGKQVVTANQRAPFDLLFGIKDMVADKIMIGLKPSPKMSSWAKKVPMEVIEYCYKMVPYKKTSFVWDVGGDSKKFDYIVVVIDDDKVQRSNEYAAFFKS